jgi:hypothetical protein
MEVVELALRGFRSPLARFPRSVSGCFLPPPPPALPQVLAARLGYLGSVASVGCHKEITSTQSHTNMALTWPENVPA